MKKIVIVGGGFAGSWAAAGLQKKFSVTLIDTKDYFEFTPGILRTVIEPQHLKKIQAFHKDYLRRMRCIEGHVTEITKTEVRVGNTGYAYDYLIIASGSRYNPPIKESDIVVATRAKHLQEYHQKLQQARSVLIIGGGPVGAELAAEICEHFPNKHITIVHAGDRLLERAHPKASAYAAAFLTQRKVHVRYNERIIGTALAGGFMTDRSQTIQADITFLCTGIVPNSEFLRPQFADHLDSHNFLTVNEHLQVAGAPHIFAAGDINNCQIEKTAQNSQRQAALVVHNIKALETGKPLKTYSKRPTAMVLSLGKWHGIFTSGSFVFTGLLPGLLKNAIEMREMWRHR